MPWAKSGESPVNCSMNFVTYPKYEKYKSIMHRAQNSMDQWGIFFEICVIVIKCWCVKVMAVQVNRCQKFLFLHQLTHNMTTDCSLNYQFSTWKLQAQNIRRTCCVHKLFSCFCFDIQNSLCTQHVLLMFWACSFHVLNW
jgi:hypothetical protein